MANRKAEVAIVGGGCIGVSIAYHLALLGVSNVILIERAHLGWGSTGKSTGIIKTHYTNEVTTRMALEGLKFFQDFGRQTNLNLGFQRTGYLLVVGEGQETVLARNVESQKRLGVNVRLVQPNELKRMQPNANVENVKLGAYEPDSGYADAAESTRAVGSAATRLGVTVLENVSANDITVSEGRVTGIGTSEGTIEAPKVIVATNVWSNQLLGKLGIQLPISGVREQNCQFVRPPTFNSPLPIWADTLNQIYFRPEGANRIVVGTLESDLPRVDDPDTIQDAADFSTINEFGSRLAARYPAMLEGRHDTSWAGPYDVTPDWQPILDEWPSFKGLYIAAGFSGHGFKFFPAVGRMMASFVHEDKKPSGMEIFYASRFVEGKLIKDAAWSWAYNAG